MIDSALQFICTLGNSSLQQSVFETSSESFSQNDLQQFQMTYDLTVQAADPSQDGGFEGSCSLIAGMENYYG